MKDFLNNDLAIGDTVVLMVPNYRSFVKGKIFEFTPKQVRVEYTNTWNYGNGLRYEILQYPSQLIKVVE